MTCVETYPRIDQAHEKKRLLASHGVAAHVVVDPLESMAPALSPFKGVGLMVKEVHADQAMAILREVKKAS